MGFCTNCGKPVADGAVFCTNCGQKIGARNMVPPSQTTPVPPVPPVYSQKPVQSAYDMTTTASVPQDVHTAGDSQPPRPAGGPWTGQTAGFTQNTGYTQSSGYAQNAGGAAPPREPKKEEDPKKEKNKKSFLPVIITIASILTVLGAAIAILYFFHFWPFDDPGQETRKTTEAPWDGDNTTKERETEKVPEWTLEPTVKPSETDPSGSEAPATEAPTTEEPTTEEPTTEEPTTEEPTTTEAPTAYPESFLGKWYGDQRTIFILYDDGTVDYYDGGVDGNQLAGTWTMDEATGLFEMDLFGGSNRFYLYAELTRGYESTIMYRMSMNWKKSTTKVWYYENFFREPPTKYVEGVDRIPQPYEEP